MVDCDVVVDCSVCSFWLCYVFLSPVCSRCWTWWVPLLVNRMENEKKTTGVKPGATWWARDARRHWRQKCWEERTSSFEPPPIPTAVETSRRGGGDRKKKETHVLHSGGQLHSPSLSFFSGDSNRAFRLDLFAVNGNIRLFFNSMESTFWFECNFY
jgi:hypothetical protein